MDRVTIVLQDAPYGNEKAWNALRLSEALLTEGVSVRIFLYGDSVSMGKKGRSRPRVSTISATCSKNSSRRARK